MGKKVKISHLTSVHAPGDTRIFLKECRTLARAGFDVTLVAQGVENSETDGVHIRGVRKSPNRIYRMTRTTFAVYRKAIESNPEICHFHDPELIPVGVLLKLGGRKVIYDAHEDVPLQILTKHWIPKILRPAISTLTAAMEIGATALFDQIIPATPAIATKFPKKRTTTVQNFPLADELLPPRNTPFAKRPPHVAYVGSISPLRGIKEMVESLPLVEDLGAQMILAGTFCEKNLQHETEQLPGWKFVDYRGVQNRSQVAELLSETRAGLVLFHPAPNHMSAQPNKLFEYMSAGLPIICSDFPLWRDLVGSTEAGILVNPRDPKEIAKAVRWVIENPREAEAMGKRGQAAVHSRFNWDAEGQKLVSVYEKLSARPTA